MLLQTNSRNNYCRLRIEVIIIRNKINLNKRIDKQKGLKHNISTLHFPSIDFNQCFPLFDIQHTEYNVQQPR